MFDLGKPSQRYLNVVGNDNSLPWSGPSLSCSTLVGSGPKCIHRTSLESFSGTNIMGYYEKSVIDIIKKFYNIKPW